MKKMVYLASSIAPGTDRCYESLLVALTGATETVIACMGVECVIKASGALIDNPAPFTANAATILENAHIASQDTISSAVPARIRCRIATTDTEPCMSYASTNARKDGTEPNKAASNAIPAVSSVPRRHHFALNAMKQPAICRTTNVSAKVTATGALRTRNASTARGTGFGTRKVTYEIFPEERGITRTAIHVLVETGSVINEQARISVMIACQILI